MGLYECLDRLNQVWNAPKATSTELLDGQCDEPPFDQAQLRGTGGNDVQAEARQIGQPLRDGVMFMGTIIHCPG